MIRRRFKRFLVLLLLSAPACRSQEWKQKLITARAPMATFREFREKDGKVVPQGFAHPPKVSADTLRAILKGLKYRPTGFLGASRAATAAPVFTEEEVAVLAAPLSKDLEKIGADERLRFLLARTSWKPFAAGTKGTSAVIFFDEPQRMNLAFDLIDDSVPESAGDPQSMVFAGDPVTITGKDPVVVPPPGAFLHSPAQDGNGYPRWVVLDPRLITAIPEAALPAAGKEAAGAPAGTAAAAPRPAPPSPEEESEAIKRKLKVLDDLRKDGVINTEEYEKTRQEILLQRGR